jgi:hypothetical protein
LYKDINQQIERLTKLRKIVEPYHSAHVQKSKLSQLANNKIAGIKWTIGDYEDAYAKSKRMEFVSHLTPDDKKALMNKLNERLELVNWLFGILLTGTNPKNKDKEKFPIGDFEGDIYSYFIACIKEGSATQFWNNLNWVSQERLIEEVNKKRVHYARLCRDFAEDAELQGMRNLKQINSAFYGTMISGT